MAMSFSGNSYLYIPDEIQYSLASHAKFRENPKKAQEVKTITRRSTGSDELQIISHVPHVSLELSYL